MKFTTVITTKTHKKITRNETKLEAILNAWEEKMNGNTVKVLDDSTAEIIYR